MRALQALVLLFLVKVSFSVRTYCYSGWSCQNSTQCTQNTGQGFGSWGLCCSGRCTQLPTTVYRGQACDGVCNVCAGGTASGGLSCTNGVCTAAVVTQGCDCTNTPCASTSTCMSNTCQLQNEGNGASCVTTTQCLSRNCSQTCLQNQLGGPCTVFNYPDMCNNGFCPQWGTDPRAGICRAYGAVGADCMANSDCQSGLECTGNSNTGGGFNSCQQPVNAGATCPAANLSPNYPCGQTNTLVCNEGKCTNVGSVGDGGACNVTAACSSGYCNQTSNKCYTPYVPTTPIGQSCNYISICANNGICFGQNIVLSQGTCVNQNSQPDGTQCWAPSYTSVCYDGSVCLQAQTGGTYNCTRIRGKSCDPNSTTSDSTQCASGYFCGCDKTCDTNPTNSPLPSCSTYNANWQASGYPSNMAPTTMPSNALKLYAAYQCCNACWRGTVSRTASTGYTISCDSGKGYSISYPSKNNCNVSLTDDATFQACDKYSGAMNTASVSPFIFILSLLSITFFFA